MLFRQLFDRETSTYTYLLGDQRTQAAILVDPVLEQVERDSKLLTELGLSLRYCLETHIHADHITGTAKLREMTGCLGIVPDKAQAICADRYIKDGEILQLASITIQAIAMTLFIVGSVSLIGVIPHWQQGNVNLKTAFMFGSATMLGAYIGAKFAALQKYKHQ